MQYGAIRELLREGCHTGENRSRADTQEYLSLEGAKARFGF